MKRSIYTDDAFPSVIPTDIVAQDYDRKEIITQVEDGLSKCEWAAVIIAAHLASSASEAMYPDDSLRRIPSFAAQLAENVLSEVEERRQSYLKAEKAERQRMQAEASEEV